MGYSSALRHACAIAAIVGLTGCDNRPDQWDAFIYFEGVQSPEYQIRGFKTFELCQAAAQRELLKHGSGAGSDYECGYKCGPSSDYGGLNVCEETRK